ncbi:class D beta-lactamase [Salinisphaera sp. P385]|uniref:Beta-lactamase n=1 Tax=Spectribacter acetivorans TaxID=3075603 RepID=A0ABU3B5C9_9GAMM|nr:class D beta-lactamase [Salinisphaera sp. P385]MDT0617042.1 class D beta-lactamase [Salinisphaera sp. P385]
MKWLVGMMLGFAVMPALSAEWTANAEVEALFDRAGVTGTFVLYEPDDDSLVGHNEPRARTRFVPASTFKIPNSLIGLATGAVASVDTVLPYGGQPQPYPAWERDMGLRDAIAISNVPIYQALARRIGLERMQAWVAKLGFGNEDIGTVVDRFWLDGPLAISAVEQTKFLARLAGSDLPVSEEIQASVREIVLLDEGDDWRLYGKTGWENAPDPGVGWWVGWVEKDDRVYAFALNMAMQADTDPDVRIELGRACLEALGVLSP